VKLLGKGRRTCMPGYAPVPAYFGLNCKTP
jgi:hypothetical protein